MTKIYNYQPFSRWRGVQLLHRKSLRNLREVAFIARHDAVTTPEQREFQARLAQITAADDIFRGIRPAKIIMGEYDRVVREQTAAAMARVFPDAAITVVPSGHMPTVECVGRICDTIMS